jgi:hypothetical protein
MNVLTVSLGVVFQIALNDVLVGGFSDVLSTNHRISHIDSVIIVIVFCAEIISIEMSRSIGTDNHLIEPHLIILG